jgi:hypothetical protein
MEKFVSFLQSAIVREFKYSVKETNFILILIIFLTLKVKQLIKIVYLYSLT